MVLALTGPVHGGKTTYLERAWPRWTARGLACGGFLSPAVTGPGLDCGYDLLELPSLSRRPFLRRRGGPGDERIGPFVFVPEALDRARAILRSPVRPDLLVVDEVGPLELAGGGLWPALREAVRRPAPALLCVVREGITDGFAARIAPIVPVFFDLRDPEDLTRLDERLLASAGRRQGP
jgi:nucleoside-triphosphatase THEP1